MHCENMNSQIDIAKGDPFDFHCTSTRKFHSCVLERTGTDLKSVHCTCIMYTPSSFFGAGGQTELQRAGYDCDLDIQTPYRIQIIEKHNQMQCHLKINSSDIIGKHISKHFFKILSSISIIQHDLYLLLFCLIIFHFLDFSNKR